MFRQSQDRVAAIIGTVSRAKKPTSLSFQFLPAYLTVFPSFVSSPRAAAREKSRAFHAFRNVLIGIFCGRIERRKTRSVCLDWTRVIMESLVSNSAKKHDREGKENRGEKRGRWIKSCVWEIWNDRLFSRDFIIIVIIRIFFTGTQNQLKL